ncbi:MAG: hypothetical protein HYU36_23765 [Planctomycetes bacterium]|nr:hypothetical protein [Planctomycetota bacterium]
MNPILQTTRWVARRLTFNRAVNLFFRCGFHLVCVFTLVALADRLFYLGFSPYTALFLALGTLIPISLVRSMLKPVSLMRAARAVDERLGLEERLSTALYLQGSDEPAAQAVLLDAQRHAESIRPQRHFPYQFPREMRYLPVPVLTLALVWGVMPSLDLLKRETAAQELAKDKARMKVEAQALKDRTQRLKKKMEEVKSPHTADLVRQLEKAADDLKAAKDKKEGFLKLSELGDQLKNRQEELQKILENHKRFQPGAQTEMMKELEQALAQGDHEAARKQLEKLSERLREEGDKLGQEEREKLARELDHLGDRLPEQEKLSKAMKSAAAALRRGTPQGMQRSLEELESAESELADLEQLQEELEMIDLAMKELDMAKECMSCQAIFSEFCPSCNQKLCRTCGTDECECCGEGQVEKCKLKVCRGGSGNGKGGVGIRSNRGGGSGQGQGQGGGSGRGSGQRQRGDLESAGFEKTKVKGQIGKGPVLGSFMVKGLPPRGETTVEYSEVVTHYKEAAEDALDKERIPANYRDLVREYFESIETPGGQDNGTGVSPDDAGGQAHD